MDRDNERLIRLANEQDIEDLVEFARLLWPDSDLGKIKLEFEEAFLGDNGTVFICFNENKAIGFAHCSLRADYVEGAENCPTAYLEGIYVLSEYRGQGVARDLLRHCENWAKEKGCSEIASDCEFGNLESVKFHLGIGFGEVNRIICFLKKI